MGYSKHGYRRRDDGYVDHYEFAGYQIESGALPFGGHATLGDVAHYWKLGEASGQRRDSVGTAHITIGGDAETFAGVSGNCTRENSGGSNIISSTGLQAATTVTHAFWLKTASATGEAQILNYHNLSPFAYDYQITVSSNGVTTAVIGRYYDTGQATVDTPDLSYSYNTWTHFIIEINPTTKKITGYVNNGAAQASPALGNPGNATGNRGLTLYSDTFYTYLDEWGFWNRALIAQERTDLYNGGAGLFY